MKVLKIIIAVVVFLGIAIYATSNFILEPMLKDRVKQALNKSDTLYTISFGELEVHLLGGDIHARNISISPKKISGGMFSTEVNELHLEGIDVLEYVFTKRLDLNQIDISGVEFISYSSKSQKTEEKKKNSKSGGKLKIVNIGRFNLDSAKIQIINVDGESQSKFLSANVKGNITNISFDPDTSGVAMLNYDSIGFLFDKIALNMADSLREVKVGQIALIRNQIDITDVQLNTVYEKYELSDAVGHQIDWIDLGISSISVNNFMLKQALFGGGIKSSSVIIEKPELVSFRDRRAPAKEKKKEKDLIYGMINAIKMPVAIDSIKMKNGRMEYQEHVKEMEEYGNISFQDFNMQFYNFTNDSSASSAQMHVQTSIMGKAELTIDWDIPLSSGGSTKVNGTLQPMMLTEFNPLIRPVAYTRIKSGENESMDFTFSYNDNSSNGELRFRYKNLSIETISKQTGESDGIFSGIKTFFANIVIQDSNTGENIRVGKIEFERKKKKSIFNYWWKSLLTGIKDSIGVPTKGA